MNPLAASRLHAKVVGDSDKPLLVFCHGLFGQGKNFGGIVKTLQTDYRCLMLDMPNHGRSDWVSTVSYQQMADSVAAVLQHEYPSAEGCTLVGHSMGGKVAMRVALMHPELVRRLVVVDISPIDNADISYFGPIMAALEGLDLASLRSRAEADRILSRDIPDDTVRHFLMQNLRHELHRQWHWQMNLTMLSRHRQGIADWPATQGRQYNGPVLWVKGEWSRYIQRSYLPMMQDLFERLTLVTIKNSGHWVHSEQPEAFMSALKSFITATE